MGSETFKRKNNSWVAGDYSEKTIFWILISIIIIIITVYWEITDST